MRRSSLLLDEFKLLEEGLSIELSAKQPNCYQVFYAHPLLAFRDSKGIPHNAFPHTALTSASELTI